MIRTSIGRLRIIALLEGLSFVLLLFVAMPLKYYGDYPNATKELGMIHGVLFMAYIYLMIPASKDHAWNVKTIILVFAASLLPGGTFVADKRIFQKAQADIQ